MKPIDEHPWRAAIFLAVILTIGGMLWSMFIRPTLVAEPPGPRWDSPADVWHVMLAGHFVEHGRLFDIYEAGSIWDQGKFTGQYAGGQYQAGPLMPILLAPVAFLGTQWNLGEVGVTPSPRPSMWVIYGPYAMMLASVGFLYAIRAFAAAGGIRDDILLRVQVVAGALFLIPVVGYYGHFDDALALAFVLLCAKELTSKRWFRAAVMLGIAVGFKQWAWMVLPLLWVVTPKEHRLRSLWPAFVAPAAYFALALIIDWRFASSALFQAETCPACGHIAIWLKAGTESFIAGPLRFGVVIVAILVAWWMRDRRDAPAIAAAIGVTLLARLLFEPVVYSYVLVPGIVALILYEEFRFGRPWRTLVLGAGALLLFQWDPSNRFLWWAPFLGLVVAAAWPAAREVFDREALEAARSDEPRSARRNRSDRESASTR